jgi:uncharacterized protein
MYALFAQQFVKSLRNLDTILGKAVHYAEARKFPLDNIVTQRLAPDMLPFTKQIQIACDIAKGAAAQLSGTPVPKFEDNEKTIAELRERIAKTIGFIEGIKLEEYSKTNAKSPVKMNQPGKGMHAEEFLVQRALPNFYFHVAMTYALLRQGGVDIGKQDYLGTQNTFDL